MPNHSVRLVFVVSVVVALFSFLFYGLFLRRVPVGAFLGRYRVPASAFSLVDGDFLQFSSVGGLGSRMLEGPSSIGGQYASTSDMR